MVHEFQLHNTHTHTHMSKDEEHMPDIDSLQLTEKSNATFTYSKEVEDAVLMARNQFTNGTMAIVKRSDTAEHIVVNRMVEQYAEWPADDESGEYETLPVFSAISGAVEFVMASPGNVHKTHFAGYDYPVLIDMATADLLEGFECTPEILRNTPSPGSDEKHIELLFGVAIPASQTDNLKKRVQQLNEESAQMQQQEHEFLKFYTLRTLTEELEVYMGQHIASHYLK